VAAGVAPDRLHPPEVHRWLDLSRLALRHLAGRPTSRDQLLPDVDLDARGTGAVEALESAASAARDARALLRQVPGVAGVTDEQARDVELGCSTRITELLPEAIRTTRAGRCRDCGQACPPWFPTCSDCR
jgi:ATP-dependent RNA helicase SUPV3L1/SUV3